MTHLGFTVNSVQRDHVMKGKNVMPKRMNMEALPPYVHIRCNYAVILVDCHQFLSSTRCLYVMHVPQICMLQCTPQRIKTHVNKSIYFCYILRWIIHIWAAKVAVVSGLISHIFHFLFWQRGCWNSCKHLHWPFLILIWIQSQPWTLMLIKQLIIFCQLSVLTLNQCLTYSCDDDYFTMAAKKGKRGSVEHRTQSSQICSTMASSLLQSVCCCSLII